MATIVTRSGKGSPLTHAEVDSNFTNLNTDKLELSGGTMTGNLSFGDNDKAIFGNSQNLEIYANGGYSYIDEVGANNLNIRTNGADIGIYDTANSQYMARFATGGNARLFYDGDQKIATTSTGIDVTGTVTADGLTLDGSGSSIITTLNRSDSTTGYINFKNTGTTTGFVGYESTDFVVYADNVKVLQASDGGDISFYDSAGSSQSFFWDASAESLGIGTSSPSALLDVVSSGTGAETIAEFGNGNISKGLTIETDGNLDWGFNATNRNLTFSTSQTERMRITSSGNVDIGSTNGSTKLSIAGGVGTQNGTEAAPTHTFYSDSNTGMYRPAADHLGFSTGGSEAMRIDSSGNLLVGTTDASAYNNSANSTADNGLVYEPAGALSVARSAGVVQYFNRTTSDGDIVAFRKSGTTVGSIGVNTAGASDLNLSVMSGDVGLRFRPNDDSIIPINGSGAFRDNAIDLGLSNARFDDIYATNGTIQTSDQNEKQDIAELSDAEQRVAVAAKGLLRKFRWRDAVAEKGDDARTHFGIIAQDLQAAFAAEGLDAGDYAMFIHSTWTDEETGEERSRMGVRYSELLAFIIAAI